MIQAVEQSKYLAIHKKYLTREFRVVFYTQFLESYKTVTLQTMAASFAVSVDFIDRELSELISSGRLNCKIDKVSSVVESNRGDDKNAYFSKILKEGDYVLNRMQKLTRLIDVWSFIKWILPRKQSP